MSELLDSAIEEINRVLIGNKDRNTEEVYLKNAIRYIREYGSKPQLNENQQIVLKSLKNKYVGYPIETIFMLQNELVKNSKINVVEAYKKLSGKEEMQVLQVFIQWVLEQEEHNERS